MSASARTLVTGAERVQVARMARSGGLSMVGAAASAVAGLLLTVFITRGLDQTAAGTVFATTAAFLIVTSFAQLGAEVGVVRFIPALLVRGEHAEVPAVLRTALVPVVTVATTASVAGLVLAPQVARLIVSDAPPDVATDMIRVLAVFVPLAASYQVLLAATRGLRTMFPTVVVEALGRSGAQVLAVAVVQLLGLGAVAVVLAYSVPYALALAAVVGWLVVLLRRASGDAAEPVASSSVAVAPAGRFWHFTAPRAVSTASQILLKRSDIVLLAALRSPREAALYAAASRFVAVGQLGVQALQQALGPQLAALFATSDDRAARAVYRATTAWSMLLAWPTYLICAVLAPELLQVFGDGYDEVADVAVVLSLGMLVATACGAVDTVLLMSGHAWLSLGNSLLALAVNVALNLVLIPRMGAEGAGIAWAAAIVVRNVLPLLQIWLLHRISPVGRETMLVGLSSILCLGALPLAVRLLTSSVIVVVVALVVGGLTYVALVWSMRRQLQLGAFRGALRRRGRDQPQEVL